MGQYAAYIPGRFHYRHARPNPRSREERLENMRRELQNRIEAYGPEHWLVDLQLKSIAREEGQDATET